MANSKVLQFSETEEYRAKAASLAGPPLTSEETDAFYAVVVQCRGVAETKLREVDNLIDANLAAKTIDNLELELNYYFYEDAGRHDLDTFRITGQIRDPSRLILLSQGQRRPRKRSIEIVILRHFFMEIVPRELVSRIISANIKYVLAQAKSHQGHFNGACGFVDIVQVGIAGLLEALWCWQRKSKKFLTHAHYYINKFMRKMLKNDGFFGAVRIPEHRIQEMHQLDKFIWRYYAEHGEAPGVLEVARRLEISARRAENLTQRIAEGAVVQENHFDEDEERGARASLLEDPTAFNPEQAFLVRESLDHYQSLRARILVAIPQLFSKDRLHKYCEKILLERIFKGRNDMKSIHELGSCLGITGARVGQLESEILAKVTHRFHVSKDEVLDLDDRILRLAEIITAI